MKKEVQNDDKKKSCIAFWKNISKTKKVIIFLVSILVIFGIIASITYIILKPDKTENNDSIFYYPASESKNIFQNSAYMSFERSLRYSYAGIEQLFQYEVDYDSADPYCKFFLDYFKTAIEGNGKGLVDFYVDGYFESEPKITMQMIYEPSVVFHSEGSIEENGKKIDVANFDVRYKIFKNNGSFRQGVNSNQAVPQIYQLINIDGKIKIKNILEIEFKNEN